MTTEMSHAVDREQEIIALKQRNRKLEAALEDFIDSADLPEKNCSCHLCPPCSDCVEFSHLRGLVDNARAALKSQS